MKRLQNQYIYKQIMFSTNLLKPSNPHKCVVYILLGKKNKYSSSCKTKPKIFKNKKSWPKQYKNNAIFSFCLKIPLNEI